MIICYILLKFFDLFRVVNYVQNWAFQPQRLFGVLFDFSSQFLDKFFRPHFSNIRQKSRKVSEFSALFLNVNFISTNQLSITVLRSYSERPYSEQIVIFRKIISAPIVNKPKVTQKKYFCDRKKSVIWLWASEPGGSFLTTFHQIF